MRVSAKLDFIGVIIRDIILDYLLDCGWIKEKDFYKKIIEVRVFGETGFAIKMCENCVNNTYVILRYSWDNCVGEEEVIFKGEVKDKRTLKKLLKQLDAD